MDGFNPGGGGGGYFVVTSLNPNCGNCFYNRLTAGNGANGSVIIYFSRNYEITTNKLTTIELTTNKLTTESTTDGSTTESATEFTTDKFYFFLPIF